MLGWIKRFLGDVRRAVAYQPAEPKMASTPLEQRVPPQGGSSTAPPKDLAIRLGTSVESIAEQIRAKVTPHIKEELAKVEAELKAKLEAVTHHRAQRTPVFDGAGQLLGHIEEKRIATFVPAPKE